MIKEDHLKLAAVTAFKIFSRHCSGASVAASSWPAARIMHMAIRDTINIVCFFLGGGGGGGGVLLQTNGSDTMLVKKIHTASTE